MARDHILHKVRTAIGRSAAQAPDPPPAVLLTVPQISIEQRLQMFSEALEKLSGKAYVAGTPGEARAVVARLIEGRSAVASNAQFLRDCGITSLRGVLSGMGSGEQVRHACATADVGITSADYALADTGSLVSLSCPDEARLVSLLPPVHVAVVPKDRLLTGLDELFAILPDPAAVAASMVIITGPSRTADIEQILVRGVHGPGQVHVVLV